MVASPPGSLTAPLYQQLLGPAWMDLALAVRELHGEARGESQLARGTFRVRRGLTWLSRALGTLLRMPAAAERVAVTLRVQRATSHELWQRVFGDHPLVSRQWARGSFLVEALGPIQCVFRLHATGGALSFEQVGASFGYRRFAFALPWFLAPRVTGRASVEGDALHVVVSIAAPGLGLVVGYDGQLDRPDRAEP